MIVRAPTAVERLLIERLARDFTEARDKLKTAAGALFPEMQNGCTLNPDTLNIERADEPAT